MYQPRPSIFCRTPLRPTPLPHILPSLRATPRIYKPFRAPYYAEPLLPSTPPDHLLPLYIDSSMLSLWRSCARKHYWSTLRGLYPSGKSVHLVAGGAVAAGLEAARRYVFAQPDPTSVPHQDILEACYSAFLYEWGDYDPPSDNPRNAKTFVNTFSALSAYLEEFHPGRDPVQPMIRTDGSPAVEYRFAIPLPIDHPCGDPFLFVGRFDMLGTYNFMGQHIPVVLDEKTSQSFTSDWADKWDLRGQFIGYIWALRQQGLSISHAVPRGIAIQKTQFDNRTGFVMYPDHIIDEWYRQLLRDITDIKTSYTALQLERDPDLARSHYPMDFADACDSYGGCAFRTLCNSSSPEMFVSNYIFHRWDPLARQPVSEPSAPSASPPITLG